MRSDVSDTFEQVRGLLFSGAPRRPLVAVGPVAYVTPALGTTTTRAGRRREVNRHGLDRSPRAHAAPPPAGDRAAVISRRRPGAGPTHAQGGIDGYAGTDESPPRERPSAARRCHGGRHRRSTGEGDGGQRTCDSRARR